MTTNNNVATTAGEPVWLQLLHSCSRNGWHILQQIAALDFFRRNEDE
jgi:hypothetical protein